MQTYKKMTEHTFFGNESIRNEKQLRYKINIQYTVHGKYWDQPRGLLEGEVLGVINTQMIPALPQEDTARMNPVCLS